MNVARPDPDTLLGKLQREEERAARGHLKIFFGACAGVGKTCAMLRAAHAEREKGRDIVTGVIETHGRKETQQLADGLEVLPPRAISYKDKTLYEFDLDAALQRKPALILMDELAHSNIAGSRHSKRWQDVEELLSAGISVYTTVNVQHLETLNDIVGQITGIRVWETVPDRIFDMADEIMLVDIPPDELLRRLQEGKVYLEQQAQRAARHFFRKGNLIALRELALRRTADQVDVAMRDYRADKSIQQVWQAKERLMLCVPPGAAALKLVRSAGRLASGLRADWIAVFIETEENAASDSSSEAQRKAMKLAAELGAETTTLAGEDIAGLVLAYAHSRNVSRLVIPREHRHWLQRLRQFGRPALADALSKRDHHLDIILIHAEAAESVSAPETAGVQRWLNAETGTGSFAGFGWAALACTAITALSGVLTHFFDLANVVMLYLLAVVLISVKLGRNAAVFGCFLSVASFDFFFVPPRFSFNVSDSQYLLTFFVMLAVSLIISQLTATLRAQTLTAHYRERRTSALYTTSKALSGALMYEQIIEIALEHLTPVFQARIAILLPDSQDVLRQPVISTTAPHDALLPEPDLSVAQWVYSHHQAAGLGTDTLPSASALYVPLRAPMRTRGVLAIAPLQNGLPFPPDQQLLLDTFAAQIALALERVHYVEVAQDAVVSMEAERLRNSLLSAVSHDLRTPLTAIVGLASTLQQDLAATQRDELNKALLEESLRMNGLVVNLLEMARLQSGKVTLQKQWQPVEEVIGSALRASAQALKSCQISTQLAPDLPLVELDAVLIERVLCNLLENAARYGHGEIQLRATADDGAMLIGVCDNGPGLPAGVDIFEKFTRGNPEAASPGVGLGLAICETIMRVHHGSIRAENRAEGGACLTITLPLGEHPPLPPSAEEEYEHE